MGLTESLAPIVAAAFPDSAPLNPKVQSNKLAVCLGGGSKYDKHVDNGNFQHVGEASATQDLRKLTVKTLRS